MVLRTPIRYRAEDQIYFGVKGTSLEDADKKLEKLKNAMVTA